MRKPAKTGKQVRLAEQVWLSLNVETWSRFAFCIEEEGFQDRTLRKLKMLSFDQEEFFAFAASTLNLHILDF